MDDIKSQINRLLNMTKIKKLPSMAKFQFWHSKLWARIQYGNFYLAGFSRDIK